MCCVLVNHHDYYHDNNYYGYDNDNDVVGDSDDAKLVMTMLMITLKGAWQSPADYYDNQPWQLSWQLSWQSPADDYI